MMHKENTHTNQEIPKNSTSFKNLSDRKVVVCSLIHNVSQNFPNFRQIVENLVRPFGQYHIIVYENGSTDNTLDLAKEWSFYSPITVLHDDDSIRPLFDKNKFGRDYERTVYMSTIRNKYLQVVQDAYSDWDYMIVMDGDINKFDPYRQHSLFDFIQKKDWDVVTSFGLDKFNGKLIYYDIWSLVIDNTLYDGRVVYPKTFPNITKVQSAFGGLACYRIPSIYGCKYQAVKVAGNSNPQLAPIRVGSEHVGLHTNMIYNGCDRIFINPKQILIR